METLEKTPMSQVAEIQITYKPVIKPSQRPKIDCSKDVYELLSNNWDTNKIEFVEQFKIILLNRANRVLGILDISTGGFAGTVADPKVIFGAALKAAASSIILAHNHPSGKLMASDADLQITKRIKEAGKTLEIQVLDHIIITENGYFSFQDENIF